MNTSGSSASASSSSSSSSRSQLLRAGLLTVVSVFMYCAALGALSFGAFELYGQQQVFAEAHTDALARIESISEQIDRRLSDIEVNTPPSSSTMYSILTRATTVAEVALKTDSATATPEAAFATDLTTVQKTDAFVQQIIIRNASSDNGLTGETLCWAWTPWAGVNTCQTTCAASAATMTCSGAATDGAHIAPGSEIARRLDGTSCVCIIGSATNVEYQTQRSVR